MKFKVAALSFALVLGVFGYLGAIPSSNVIAVESGKLEGQQQDGVRVFKGIPYAAAPLGPLRWRAPQPPAKWTGTRKANGFGAACAQPDFSQLSGPKTIGRSLSGIAWVLWMDVPNAPDASEDCLFLNIWTPLNAAQAPVMVFIHGGGGSGAIPVWDGSAFARDGVVLVTLNYRNFTSGKFAHPSLTASAAPSEPLSRFDLMDQIAALQWVRRNISAFGGDPYNVTLFGQSAGGASTLQLMTAPSAHGLFHKAIVQSGNGWWASFNQAQYEIVGVLLAQQAGLPRQATAGQLRSLALEAMPWIGAFNFDGRLLPEDPTAAIASGKMADIPMIIGWNSNDGSSLQDGLAEIVKNASPDLKTAYADLGTSDDDLAYRMYTDSHVAAPARWIARRSAEGQPTYLYQFSYVRSMDRAQSRGAPHSSELPYVFDSWDKFAPKLRLSDEDRKVTQIMHSCWVSFARSGKPDCIDAPEWPRYSASEDKLMNIDIRPSVEQHVRKQQLDAQTAAMAENIAAQRRSLAKLVKVLVNP
jgi:para-nitrobenzyl esterase